MAVGDPVSLPIDKRGVAIQALATGGGRAQGNISGSSDRVALPTNAAVLRISATADCYIVFGNSGVTATQDVNSVLFPKGVEVMAVPLGTVTHMAVIQVAGGTAGVYQLEALN